MEQHENYNETFGFINALTTGHENEMSEEAAAACSKQLMQGFLSTSATTTALPTNEFDSQPLPPPSATTTSDDYVQYQDISSSSQVAINPKSNDSFDIKSDPILESQQTQDSTTSTSARKDGKKRKRIVCDDDSDDGSSELKKELLNDDESKEQEQKTSEIDDSAGNGDEADVESDENDDQTSATVVNPDALKARFLLKSAIIIPDLNKKKKKQRVLDDSDDDEQSQQLQTSIDDIGMVVEGDPEVENEHVTDDIIIFNDPTSFDNEQKVEDSNVDVAQQSAETTDEVKESATKNDNQKPIQTEEKKAEMIKSEPQEATEKEENIDEVLERIKPMADDDEFFKFDKSSGEDDGKGSVNNEEYFGTPDKSVVSNAPKKRGRKPGTKMKPLSDSQKIRQKRGDRYEKDFVDDSDSGSSSSDYSDSLSSSSSSSSESSVEEVQSHRPRPVMKKPIMLMPSSTITLARVPTLKDAAKKDRFFDQSRNIPDSVYFGDVKVPLHVLHTKWNSSVEDRKFHSKSQSLFSAPSKRPDMSFLKKPLSSPSSSSLSTYITETDDPKLSTLKDLVRITGIKINYAKLFDGVKSTDHKCMIIRRILAQKGLSGEPTVAKCKKLKRDLQAKRESAELDKSLIITDEGRTRRSRRSLPPARYNEGDDFIEHLAAASHISDKFEQPVQPKVLETLSKIKSVIDSDSE